MVGQVFGEWKVIEKAPSDKKRNAKWVCECSCGKERNVYQFHLKSGASASCGCKNYKNLKTTEIRHGMSQTKLHYAWVGIRRRCLNETNINYKNYGGRGITICKEWDVFESFMEWSLQNGFSKELSIDRIDNNGNYEPNNCRWADAKTQANNTRKNVNITIDGVTKTLKQWADHTGLSYSTIYSRYKRGWSEEDIIKLI